MKKSRHLTVLLAVISASIFYQANLFSETSALPAPALGAQNSSVSAPLDVKNSSVLKIVADKISGDVLIQRQGKGDYEALGQKAELMQGDLVKTGEGLCHLVIGGKSKIVVEPNTSLSITEALKNEGNRAESTKLILQNGKLKISLPNLKNGSSFEVTTPTAVAVVRGTTFYLLVGKLHDMLMSQIYVDKSDGGVFFKNLFSGESILVPHHSISQSSEDGKVDAPKELTPEEQAAFINQWESLGGANQQFGIEEIPLVSPPPPAPGFGAGFADALSQFGLKDAFIDRFTEQNIANPNQGVATDTVSPPAPSAPPAPPAETDETPTGPVITDADKNIILDVLNQSLEEQQHDISDAGLAKTEDAQTGKVFTDVHGNRVRVDQYITQTSPSSVGFLSLTLREGAYQNGITSLFFFTQFNRELTEADGSFRDLPWNNYLNVVTHEDLTGLSAGGQFDDYIVHEHYGIPAEGIDLGPDLYPSEMLAMFMSPIQEGQTDFSNLGIILFGEVYSAPFRATSDQGEFWLQGRDSDLIAVLHGSGESAVSSGDATQPSTTYVNGVQSFIVENDDRAQTAGFSSSAGLADLDTLAGINFFRNNAVHPASFENQFGSDRVLIGYFLPISDAGQVFDAPGFRLRGLRDVLHPNTLVNGGRYNLELLFVYGELNDGVLDREIFRIDAIVTPEIFFGGPASGPGFGLKGLSGELVTDTAFPPTLESDE